MNNNIICPKCHNICNINDSFCSQCGFNLSEIKNSFVSQDDSDSSLYCPKCGSLKNKNQNFCSCCGFSFFNNNSTLPSFSLPKFYYYIIAAAFFFGIFVYLFMKLIGSVPDEQIKPQIPDENYSVLKAKNCHDNYVKDIALQIFKENDYYFKYIDSSTISDVSLKFPSMVSYNSDIDKYYCRATVYVIASENGFLPSFSQIGNHFYDELNILEHDSQGLSPGLKKFTRYQCDINYASQISQDQPYVTATACGNGSDFNNKGKFSFSYIQKKSKPLELQQHSDDYINQENSNSQDNIILQDEPVQPIDTLQDSGVKIDFSPIQST